jgi:hypothetical protein
MEYLKSAKSLLVSAIVLYVFFFGGVGMGEYRGDKTTSFQSPAQDYTEGVLDLATILDQRHEATSRLFEAGLTIEQAPLVTGHKDWKMLKRYTQLRPEGLHAVLDKRRGGET